MDAPEVSVLVIVTADGPRAQRCLASIAACTDGLAVEVVVVDNGATAEASAAVATATGVRLLRSPVDLGIPAAWNWAAEHARAPLLMTLHEDAVLEPGVLGRLVQTLSADPRVGAVQPQVLWPDGRVQSAGRCVWADGFDSPVSAGRSEPYAVDRTGSAANLLRRSALAAAGGFDEAFFPAVCVDATLGLGLWAAGAVVLCDPRVSVVHDSGAMIRQDGGPMRSPIFSHFLQQRAYARLAERWAERLASEHVPRAAGQENALARSAARAAAATGFAPGGGGVGTELAIVDVDPERAAAAVRAREALREEFLGWLVARGDLLQGEIDWRAARIVEQEEHLANQAARITELEGIARAEHEEVLYRRGLDAEHAAELARLRTAPPMPRRVFGRLRRW